MRPSNKQRSRNKQGNGGNSSNSNNQRQRMGNIINRVFESAGPDGKVRGTPQQIIDKYQALARDAQVSGDRVAAESFLQHSEHYSRLLGEAQRHQLEQQRERDEVGGRQDRPQDGGFRPQPLPQPSFGFAGIDEEEEPAGLIDTPEGRFDQPQLRPVPAAELMSEPVPAPWPNEAEASAPVEVAPPAPPEATPVETPPDPPEPVAAEEAPAPRRGRPRRRKTEPAEPKGETAVAE